MFYYKFAFRFTKFINKIMNILNPTWPKPNNIQAFTTLRNANLSEFINTKKNIVFELKQEHGINILPANNLNLTPKADGSFTQQKNLACVVKTADCLPILVTNKQGSFVSAIHAGWRSLAKGIIANFFTQTKMLNLNHQDLLFWLGPAIGPLVFEVGEDVLEQFKILNTDLYKNAFNKISNTNKNNTTNKYLANIYKIAQIALAQFNINSNQIFSENYCTYSQAELFYSYRREPSCSNRMFSVIWIN